MVVASCVEWPEPCRKHLSPTVLLPLLGPVSGRDRAGTIRFVPTVGRTTQPDRGERMKVGTLGNRTRSRRCQQTLCRAKRLGIASAPRRRQCELQPRVARRRAGRSGPEKHRRLPAHVFGGDALEPGPLWGSSTEPPRAGPRSKAGMRTPGCPCPGAPSEHPAPTKPGPPADEMVIRKPRDEDPASWARNLAIFIGR